MKVNSVRGANPSDPTRGINPIGAKSQTDITNRKMPREDLSEVILDTEVLPGLTMKLTGKDSDKEKTKKFLYNTLRMRPLIQDWIWLKSSTLENGDIKWRKICSGKDMKAYNLPVICDLASDALASDDTIVSLSISNENGISIGTTLSPVEHNPTLSLYYKKLS